MAESQSGLLRFSLQDLPGGDCVGRFACPTRSQPGRSCKLKRNNPDCDSAIGQHLLDNEQCAANYNDKRFKILAVARNSFHLCLLEATFIKTKHPVLCKQKEFVYTLKFFK